MEFSVQTRSSCLEAAPGSQSLFKGFATPAPPSVHRTYSANTLTPGAIPSPLNFPSLTPPSSPFYGLYSPSPSPQHVNSLYDPSYLRKLKSNPIFQDLQSLLVQECMQMQVPANLITTSWNLMQLNPTTSTNKTAATLISGHQEPTQVHCDKVYIRHMALQDMILKVRIDSAISADGLSVENEYSKQVGKIEMDRYRALGSCPTQVKATIKAFYDKERLSLADRTEDQLDKLIQKAENLRKSVTCFNANKSLTDPRVKTEQSKQLSEKLNGKVDGASLLLQHDGKMNAVRKLRFNNNEEYNLTNYNEEDDDYLNCSVNSEDFEIDEIDVETLDEDRKLTKENSIQQYAINTPHIQSSTTNHSLPIDLLQKCIAESGILCDDEISYSQELNTSDTSTEQTSSEHSCTSPMSLDSVKSTPSPNTNSFVDTGIHSTSNIPTYQIADSFKVQSVSTNQQSPFSLTSLYQPMKFLPVENMNMALSHMQNICSGSSVTFTPEPRRDYTPNFASTFTPKMLPLGDLSQNSNSSHENLPTSITDSFHPAPVPGYPNTYNTSMWNSPVTQPETSSPQWSYPNSGSQRTSHRQTTQSRKRKSLCDDDMEQIDLVNNNITQNSSSSAVSGNTVPESDADFELKHPTFRTHRMLTAESTNILSHWYHAHVNYPYPNEEEVEQLAQMTGITNRQVKKWMANKRVRCYNTLSITGNQHPIKYKYRSQGRKKKVAPSTGGKENNCDSTINDDKKPNYSMLTERAKQMLNNWYESHHVNPYPNEEEKTALAAKCHITVGQVKSWFANKRNRTNNTKRQVPNYFLSKHPEYSNLVHLVGQKREETRMIKRRKINEAMYIQPQFYF